MDNQADITQPQPSVGQRLQQAREQARLTLVEVATKTNLKVKVLENLEQDKFIFPNFPAAFVKGYLRIYAKFLNITITPAELTQLQFEGENRKKSRVQTVINNEASHSRWIVPLTWIIVILLIGMTVLWWWQDHQRSQDERQSFVTNHLSTQTSNSSEPNTPVVEHKKTPSTAPNEIGKRDESHSLSIPEEQIHSSTNANNETTTGTLPSTPTQTPVVSATGSTLQILSSTNAVDKSKLVYPTTSTEALASAMNQIDQNKQNKVNKKPTPTVATPTELQIEVIANNCWISVKDADNKILAQKVYFAGDKLDFRTKPPYSLVIGAPSNVKISYLGQAVPLKLTGKVLKLKLPEKG